MKQDELHILKLFLELWEIPETRAALEVKLAELQRIFGAEIEAYRRDKSAVKFKVNVAALHSDGKSLEINQDMN